MLELLARLNQIKPVWVELGLQTIHKSSSDFIRRGYELDVFEKAVYDLKEMGISVIVHTILFLPNETKEDNLESVYNSIMSEKQKFVKENFVME